MDIPTIPGAVYTISSAASCDVTDKASGQLLGTASSGSPFTTPAYSDALTLSDPAALYVQIKTFNFALAALGLLGGGESTGGGSVLPAGYLAAEFLESANPKVAYINTGIIPADKVVAAELTAQYTGGYYGNVAFVIGSVANNDSDNYQTGIFSGYWRCKLNSTAAYGTAYNREKHVFFLNTVKGTGVDDEILRNPPQQVIKSSNTKPIFLFILNNNGELDQNDVTAKRIFVCKIEIDGTLAANYISALDKHGIPCLFDQISKQPFYNSGTGQFIVGMTMNQALKLSTLPATGGTLTISLPTGYESDAGVMAALETARANGWTLTVQTYTPEAEASAVATFGMRRIWVRKTQDENGAYIDADEKRWQVDRCVEMYTPDGSTPDQHGYELFRSQEAAVAYWELSPYVDPESENLLT